MKPATACWARASALPPGFRPALPILILSALISSLPLSAQLKEITVNYPAKATANWPLFIAKEGGYYQKYGLDTTLVFGVHPAGIAQTHCASGQ